MKRIAKILLATVIMAGSHQARGDDGITGRYWFDHSTILTPFTPGLMEIPTDGLSDGLHMLNAYVEKGGLTSSVSSRWFVKSRDLGASFDPKVRLSVDGKPWDVVTGARGNGIIALDLSTAGIPEGMHLLDATVVIGSSVSSTVSRWFLKTLTLRGGESYKTTLFLDGKPWQTLDTQASGDGVMALQLDMNDVPLGFHTLQAQVVSPDGIPTGVRETMFMRVPSTAQLSTLRGYYVLDGKILGELDASMDGKVFHLDVNASQLPAGLHSVSVYLAGSIGLTTSVKTAWFVRIPEGGEGVKSYEYWLNDNTESLHTVTLPEVENPFSLISLIDMPVEPFRTTSYTFAVEEGKPVAYAKNDFQVRFSDPDGRITFGHSPFTDQRVRKAVENVQPVTENEATLNPVVSDGEIAWYSIEGEAGDSIAIRLDRSGMYELYAPDAQMLAQATGADAMNSSGVSLTKNGKHYLAVHDVADKYGKPTLYVTHIPRCAVLSWTPEKSSQQGLLVMDMHGNGFDNLKSVALEKDGVRIEPTEWVARDRYNLTAQFDLDGNNVAIGKYDIVATYKEDGKETVVTKNEGIEFVAKSKPDVSVNVVAPRIAQTPYEVHVDVVNNSDQSAWGIPVNLAFVNKDSDIAVEFKNFSPSSPDTIDVDEPAYFVTDNLLDTGEPGTVVSMVLPYIGPNETIRLTMGLYSGAHEIIRMYAWNGQPWSDEFEEMMEEGYDFDQINDPDPTNLLSAKDIVYLRTLEAEEAEMPESAMMKNRGGHRTVKTASFYVKPMYGKTKYFFSSSITGSRGSQTTVTTGKSFGVSLGTGPNPFEPNWAWHNFKVMTNHVAVPAHILFKVLDMCYNGPRVREYIKSVRKKSKPKPDPHDIDCYQSGDPNDMHGYVSPSGDNYIGAAVKSVEYTVEFENDPEIANASASVITVENKIDGKSLDLASFKPLKMIIGKKETELPAEHHFVKTLDMRPEINAIAELTFDYEAESGEARWALRSLDPMTMEPTRYMDDGILPVNDDSGRGTGYLSYSIDLRKGLADGTEIANSAVIVFDDNEPIPTPVWTNITDYTLPEAVIAGKELSEDGLSCTLTFEGSDSGSGIWYYDLYARAAGAERWELVRSQIEDDTFVYESATSLANTDFAVIATDRAGNRQSDAAINGLAGDADGNGVVNATDVVVTRNYYMDPTTQINLRNADVTVDGVVNAQDATVIRNVYLGEEVKRINNRKPTRRK